MEVEYDGSSANTRPAPSGSSTSSREADYLPPLHASTPPRLHPCCYSPRPLHHAHGPMPLLAPRLTRRCRLCHDAPPPAPAPMASNYSRLAPSRLFHPSSCRLRRQCGQQQQRRCQHRRAGNIGWGAVGAQEETTAPTPPAALDFGGRCEISPIPDPNGSMQHQASVEAAYACRPLMRIQARYARKTHTRPPSPGAASSVVCCPRPPPLSSLSQARLTNHAHSRPPSGLLLSHRHECRRPLRAIPRQARLDSATVLVKRVIEQSALDTSPARSRPAQSSGPLRFALCRPDPVRPERSLL